MKSDVVRKLIGYNIHEKKKKKKDRSNIRPRDEK